MDRGTAHADSRAYQDWIRADSVDGAQPGNQFDQ
jgi:hypothetical protein